VVARHRDESDIADLLAAKGVESKPFRPIPSRRLRGEFDYDADPGNTVRIIMGWPI